MAINLPEGYILDDVPEQADLPRGYVSSPQINLPEGFILDKPEPEQEELPGGGGLSEFGKGIVSGTLGVAKGIVGTARLATQLQRKIPALEQVYGGIEKLTGKKFEEEQIRIKQNIARAQERFPKTHQGASAWAGRVVGEAIPYMGAALAGGYAIGPIGAATVGFAVEGDSAYDEAIASGASETQAQTERVIVGSINAAIEAIQIGRLMKFHKAGKHSLKGFVGATKKRAYKEMARTGAGFTSDILKISVEEGLEEFAQEGVSIGVPAILRDEYPRKEDDTPDWWAIGERLGEAALGGAVAGGILGGTGAVINAGLSGEAKAYALSKEATEQIDKDETLTPEEKVQHKQYIGDIQTKIVEHVVETFPEQVKDQESLERVGNAIAKELGMDPPATWKWSMRKVARLMGVHRGRGIILYGRHNDFNLDEGVGSVRSQKEIKETIVHELGHMVKPPIQELKKDRLTRFPRSARIEKGTLNKYIVFYKNTTWSIAADNEQAAKKQFLEYYNETGRRSVHHLAFKNWVQENTGILETIRQEHVPLEEIAPKAVAKEKPARRKPTYAQYEAGHAIPKLLKMKTTARRKFMKKITGKTSMKEMTPEEASKYIEALHKKARKKGIETGILPGERAYKTPKVGHLGTDPLYEMHALGVAFAVRPAAIAKQRLDIEFRRIAKKIDKAGVLINRLGGETTKSKAAARLKNKPTKSIVRFAELLDTHEEPPAGLTKDEAELFNYFRVLSRAIWTRENIAREKVGLEPIAYHKAYMRHIVDMMYEDIIDGRHPVPEELVYWMKENVRTKIRNPMEFERKLKGELDKIFSKDLVAVTKAMVWTGLQEIHLDEPLVFFKNQMGLNSEVIPARTRKYAEDFIKHLILGEETQRDSDLNALITESGLRGLFNKALKPFGRKVSNRPITRLLQKGGRLQIYGVMGWRPKQLIRNKFQLVQNLMFSSTKANILSFLPPNAQCKELMEESMLLQGYKGGEDLIEIDKKTLGRLWLAPFQWTAQSNARQGMKCAYIDTMELIEDSKYKELGWADPKRTYKEEKGFIYPSEKVALLEEMELRASCAQYNYIAMAMPEVFQSKANIPLTRLQSWWMNYFFKFQREGIRRFLTGRTVTGRQLPWSRRLGWARYMVIGGLVLNTLGYSTSFLLGAMPDATPPLFTLLINSFKWCTTDNDKVRASAGRKIINAAKTFIPGYLAYKDVHALWTGKSNLTKAFTYGRGIFAPKEEGPEPGRGAL